MFSRPAFEASGHAGDRPVGEIGLEQFAQARLGLWDTHVRQRSECEKGATRGEGQLGPVRGYREVLDRSRFGLAGPVDLRDRPQRLIARQTFLHVGDEQIRGHAFPEAEGAAPAHQCRR